MPEFAAYFENSFGCNVFLWLNVIYISLSFVLFVLISLSFLMFCFRILKSTQVPQSFLFASALPPPLRSLTFSSLASLSLWLSLSLASFSLCLSLCIHRQRQRQRPLFSLALFLLRLSFCNCALCPHSLRTEKSENT